MSASAAAAPMSLMRRYWRDRALWTTIADVFAILAALTLPWSTSLVAIFVPCWLGAVAWVMDWRAYARLLKQPICYLPFALVGLAVIGTLWSDAAWGARLHAISPTLKLLVLPGLFYHFERSSRGMWVFIAFLVSCTLLMADVLAGRDRSQPFAQAPRRTGRRARHFRQELHCPEPGVRAVRGRAGVSGHQPAAGEHDLAGAGAGRGLAWLHRQHGACHRLADGHGHDADHGCGVCAAAPEMANQLDDFRRAGRAWRDWPGSPSPELQWTTETFFRDYRLYKTEKAPTSIGIRLEFWTKSLRFFSEAPVHRPRNGLDPRVVRTGRHRPCRAAPRPGDRQSPQPDARHCGSMGYRRGRPAVRDVAGASAAVSWRRARRLDRTAGRGAEHLHLAVQLAHFRFPRGMDVRARRRGCRRHDARGQTA